MQLKTVLDVHDQYDWLSSAHVAFTRGYCPADSPPDSPLSAVVSADVSVDESVEESVLLSAGPDSGHFNGLSAGLSGEHVRRTRGVAIKSREMIT
jgi:hypothetical protein